MRIAHFCWESLYGIRVGGLANAVTGWTESLARRGHEVHLFTRWKEGWERYDVRNGVHIHRCVFDYRGNMLEFAWKMCRAMLDDFQVAEREFGKFDIVHGHDWHVVDALHELKNRGYPVVMSFHSTEWGRNGNSFGDWWEFKEISGKEWYGGYIANRVSTVSRAMKGELMWLYQIPDWKIEVIPNGIYPERYKVQLDQGEVKKKYGVHPLAPLILFVGRMCYQKGPDLLVEAIPHVLRHRWDAVFFFIGDGGARAYCEQRAAQLNVSRSVRFLGWVPDEEYIQLLNACDIVCIPSRNEPFGIVLLEAWSAGKAVVVTDVGGLAENVENFVDGIKVYPYPESIAWGINYIIDDAYGVRWIGENGRKKVLSQFTWDAVAEKMCQLYTKVKSG